MSPKSSELYHNRSLTARSPERSPRMHYSPSLSELGSRYHEQESKIRLPIIADLQHEYVKALNRIDSLKAENKEMKVTEILSVQIP